MQNYDLYALLADIKAEQVKILALLQDHSNEDSIPRVYDLVQLQEILHVSKRTIATWLKEGILPHCRVGAKIWVTEEQFQEFLKIHSDDEPRQKILTVGR